MWRIMVSVMFFDHNVGFEGSPVQQPKLFKHLTKIVSRFKNYCIFYIKWSAAVAKNYWTPNWICFENKVNEKIK